MRQSCPIKLIFVILLAFQSALIVPTVALAQGYVQGPVQTPAYTVKKVGEGSQYYLGEGNELLIRVNIWGRVNRPGQYFVPATTNLITLVSLAGGPITRSRLTDVRVVRNAENGENEVILVNVKKYLATGDKRLIPDLKPEDTIVVHGLVWQLVLDVVSIVAQLSTVATVYYLFFIANK